jgi:hypothetical protein
MDVFRNSVYHLDYFIEVCIGLLPHMMNSFDIFPVHHHQRVLKYRGPPNVLHTMMLITKVPGQCT